MMAIDADTSPNTNLNFWAASSNPANAATVEALAVCATTVAVTGGQVAGLPAAAISGASCPAGTYDRSGCDACPTGYTCTGGAKTACAADKYNSFLGQTTAATDCVACYSGTLDARVSTDETSQAGSYSCTIPYARVDCASECRWRSRHAPAPAPAAAAAAACLPPSLYIVCDPSPACIPPPPRRRLRV